MDRHACIPVAARSAGSCLRWRLQRLLPHQTCATVNTHALFRPLSAAHSDRGWTFESFERDCPRYSGLQHTQAQAGSLRVTRCPSRVRGAAQCRLSLRAVYRHSARVCVRVCVQNARALHSARVGIPTAVLGTGGYGWVRPLGAPEADGGRPLAPRQGFFCTIVIAAPARVILYSSARERGGLSTWGYSFLNRMVCSFIAAISFVCCTLRSTRRAASVMSVSVTLLGEAARAF